MTKEKETLDSALLTTLVKSVKLMSTIKESQDSLIMDIKEIKSIQEQQQETLNSITKLATKKDVNLLIEETKSLYMLVNNIDTSEITKEMKTEYLALKTDISKSLNNLKQDIQESLNESNKATSIKTLTQLVDGLSNLHSNIVELASRVEGLSNNVTDSTSNTSELTSTIMESNSRIKSMDIRMGAFIGKAISDTDDPSDWDETLTLLTTLNKQIDTTTQIGDDND